MSSSRANRSSPSRTEIGNEPAISFGLIHAYAVAARGLEAPGVGRFWAVLGDAYIRVECTHAAVPPDCRMLNPLRPLPFGILSAAPDVQSE